MKSFYRHGGPTAAVHGASENAPHVLRPQGSYDDEMKAQHCDATRCTKPLSSRGSKIHKRRIAVREISASEFTNHERMHYNDAATKTLHKFRKAFAKVIDPD
jgi:hypothetical protein